MKIAVAGRGRRKAEIKAKAQEVIYARYPQWKQSNILASGDSSAITIAWAWIDSVRAYSDSLEVDVDSGVSVDLEAGWPT